MTRSGGCSEAPVTKTEMAPTALAAAASSSESPMCTTRVGFRERCMISSASIMGFSWSGRVRPRIPLNHLAIPYFWTKCISSS
ncbi:Uncharacterised protein [Mycobacterium tuberculosis]|nr:Uncharacterised protein [Mycobacterium tuberculosis]